MTNRDPGRIRAGEPASVRFPLRVGARTLFTARRRLVRAPLPLERRAFVPDLPPLAPGVHGYLVTGLRADLQADIEARHLALRSFVRHRYRRHYACLQTGFDDYLASFSAKSRSTLKRKLRKLADRSGGRLDLRCYSRPEHFAEFQHHARAVSRTTYQERLLGAGLPDGDAALATWTELAARDSVRGWLLFLDEAPIAYLLAPAERDTLLYAWLGYDPAHAEWSPGAVLQLEAMRMLMSEQRFRIFDFTEGEGQHKRQFATGSVDCVDLLMLRPTLANLAIAHGLAGFDAAVAVAKRLVPDTLARAARR